MLRSRFSRLLKYKNRLAENLTAPLGPKVEGTGRVISLLTGDDASFRPIASLIAFSTKRVLAAR
jgi:hypothetical protein